MKIHGSVVSLSFAFPHLPEDKKKRRGGVLVGASLIAGRGGLLD